jgi:hypothetical protein
MVCISVHMVTKKSELFIHNCSKIKCYYTAATDVYSEAENVVNG